MAEPTNETELAEFEAEVLHLRRTRRWTPRKIAESLGVPAIAVRNAIAKYVTEVQSKNTELVEHAYVDAVDTIDRLLELCMGQLAKHGFDRDVIRVAHLLLERQARLMGLDRAPKHAGPQTTKEWLESASNEELIEEARRMGLKIPTEMTL